MNESGAPRTPVPGRECGSCMLCCKVYAIAPLNKPSGVWCSHAVMGKGCGVYTDRPHVCRSFFCDWMVSPELGPDWKPDKAKFMLATHPTGAVTVMVDSVRPGAWREPKYYTALKTLAARIIERGGLLTVYVGRRLTVVLPDRDEDCGIVPDNHSLRVLTRYEGGRPRYQVIVDTPVPDGEAD